MRMSSLECFASLEKQRLARFVEPECPPPDAIFQLGFIATVPVSCLHGTEIVSDAMFQIWFFTSFPRLPHVVGPFLKFLTIARVAHRLSPRDRAIIRKSGGIGLS